MRGRDYRRRNRTCHEFYILIMKKQKEDGKRDGGGKWERKAE